jgi:hypothetical protein
LAEAEAGDKEADEEDNNDDDDDDNEMDEVETEAAVESDAIE